MAFTVAQLEALERAIGSGTLSVTYDGMTTTYRNTADLMAAYRLVKDELQANGLVPAARLSNRGPTSFALFTRD